MRRREMEWVYPQEEMASDIFVLFTFKIGEITPCHNADWNCPFHMHGNKSMK